MTTRASAVAGLDQVVCDFTPLFVCNPYETPGMSYLQATRALQLAAGNPSVQRRLIRMRQNDGASRGYAPGDYGFLQSPTLGNTAAELADSLAQVHRRACFRHNGVSLWRGRVTDVYTALNVRFDIYDGVMTNRRTDDNYRPAENVRKGYVGTTFGEDSVMPTPLPFGLSGLGRIRATGLPLDLEWPNMGGRMGNGNWDFETYWQSQSWGAGSSTARYRRRPRDQQ